MRALLQVVSALLLCNVLLKWMSHTWTDGSRRRREEKVEKNIKWSERVHCILQKKRVNFGLINVCSCISASTWSPLSPANFCRLRSPAPVWSWCPAASCIPDPAARCLHARWRALPRACWSCSGSRRAWRCNVLLSLLTCFPEPLSVGEEKEVEFMQTSCNTSCSYSQVLWTVPFVIPLAI